MSSPPAAEPHASRCLNVLVAEDHPVNRAYLEAMLDKLGHRTVLVAGGDSAVQAIENQLAGQAFDIVLMDLHMPGMDGFTAARMIRAMLPPRGRVPIVALTADASVAARQLALDAGMDGVLTMPTELPQLSEALARYGAEASGAAVTVLDLVTVADVREAILPAKYAELLAGFLGRRADVLAELRRALQTASREGLSGRAHALKGAALSLGLREVGLLAGRLQTEADAASTDDLVTLVDAIERQFEASCSECQRRGLLPGAAALSAS